MLWWIRDESLFVSQLENDQKSMTHLTQMKWVQSWNFQEFLQPCWMDEKSQMEVEKPHFPFSFLVFVFFSSWWTKPLTQRWTIRLKSNLRRSVLRCCNFGICMIIWSLNNLFIFRKFHFSPNITSFVSFCYFLAKFPIDYCLNYWQSIHSWKENARTKILKKVISFSKKSNWGLKVQSSNNLVAKVNKPERSTFETVKLFIVQKSPKKQLKNQFPPHQFLLHKLEHS